MSFEWPVGKLQLINRALVQSGANSVNAADDGSDEWTVCASAYEEALAILIQEHGWGFATKVNADLTASATAPDNVSWDTAYSLPSDLVHLIWVKLLLDTSTPVAIPYDIEGGMLVLNAQGGPPPPDPPVTPGTVSIKYVSSDNADPTEGTPLFVASLTRYVRAAIHGGLFGDKAEEKAQLAIAEALGQRSRTRYDQQKPKRALFNTRIGASRRIRRP